MPVVLLPIAVSKLAVANPMPCVAPVITATLASRTFRQGGGLLGALGAQGSPPPGRIPLSARLLCGQYTPSGLFLPCQQGTLCGLFDELSDGPRLRHINGVAAFDLDDR